MDALFRATLDTALRSATSHELIAERFERMAADDADGEVARLSRQARASAVRARRRADRLHELLHRPDAAP